MTAVAADSSPPLVELDLRPPPERPRQFWSAFGNDLELPLRRAPRATKLTAPSGPHASESAITKFSNRVHKEVPYGEVHVACLESLKDAFGVLASATTAPGPLGCFSSSLYAREVDVTPLKLGLEMTL